MKVSHWQPTVAAAATGILVGAAIVASRYVIDQTTPATLAMLRYVIGFLCLAPIVAIISRSGFRKRDLIPISILGIVQFGILVALLNYALQYISSARAALIFATFPLQTMLLAAALGRENLTAKKTAGVVLTIIGVTVALGESLNSQSSGNMQWLGAAAVALSAFCGAVCSILYRPYLQRYPALNIGALAMFASVAFLLVFSAMEGGLNTISHIDFNGWIAVVFIGVSSGIGYFTWLWALKHLSPVRVTIFLSLSPVSSAFLGTIFLSEPITIYLLFGITLVLTGITFALSGNNR